ncbi:MAG TPA: hypothetical protein VGB53_10065 [Rubricoccaceae bacterium]|jgi:hypothetical protein
MNRPLLVLAFLLAAPLAGCDLFDVEGTSARGTVTDARTGRPIPGIYVSLEVGGGGAFSSPLAQDITDANGEYALDDTERRFTSVVLEVNLGSTDGTGGIPLADPRYGYWSQNVEKWSSNEIEVTLNRDEVERDV